MGFLQVDGNDTLWIEAPLQQQNRVKTAIISQYLRLRNRASRGIEFLFIYFYERNLYRTKHQNKIPPK
jgi:hypothetical protein